MKLIEFASLAGPRIRQVEESAVADTGLLDDSHSESGSPATDSKQQQHALPEVRRATVRSTS